MIAIYSLLSWSLHLPTKSWHRCIRWDFGQRRLTISTKFNLCSALMGGCYSLVHHQRNMKSQAQLPDVRRVLVLPRWLQPCPFSCSPCFSMSISFTLPFACPFSLSFSVSLFRYKTAAKCKNKHNTRWKNIPINKTEPFWSNMYLERITSYV